MSDSYHRLIKERGVDFILCPAYIGAGAKLESVEYFPYTSAWNILDMPCITFPSGLKVDPEIDVVDKDYKPRSEKDKREYETCKSTLNPFIKQNRRRRLTIMDADVPETFEGAPIALQLVGKHFRDEETVAATDLVSKIIRGD